MNSTGPAVTEPERGAATGRGPTDASTSLRSLPHSLAATARRHRAMVVVALAFGASALLVPTLAPVSVSDDAMYSRTVETLLRHGRFEVLPLSAVPQVFQTAWGGLFGLVFGPTLGVLRASTVVLVLLGGWAVYGLCRELGVSGNGSALGSALYLFNPLNYVLGFTFMSDAPLGALVAISTYCYLRGLGDGDEDGRWLVAGSAASAAAFLTRQPGALVAVAVAGYLVASRRAGGNRRGVVLLARVLAVPALVAGAYLAWAYLFDGLPTDTAQGYVAGQLAEAPHSVLWFNRILFTEAVYPGFFVLPLVLAAVGSGVTVARRTRVLGWLAVAGWAVVVIHGLVRDDNGAMPYFPSFLTNNGLGPGGDLHGGRPLLPGSQLWVPATVLCLGAMVFVILAVIQRLTAKESPGRPRAALVLWVLGFQAVAVFATSSSLRADPAASRDRYLLPLLPLTVALVSWTVRNLRVVAPVAWLATAAFAVYAVAGTHDSLNLQAAAWGLGNRARAQGVALQQIDVGAGWAAYHRYQRRERPLPPDKVAAADQQLVPPSERDVATWWTGVYQPATVFDYLVSTRRLLGYTEVRRQEYSSWLDPDPTYVYLLRRDGYPGPP